MARPDPLTGRHARSSAPAWDRWTDRAFWLMIAASLAPLLAFSYLPSSDGGFKVHNAQALADYLTRPDSPVRSFLALNPKFPPNIFDHLLLAVLLQWTRADIAERLLVGGYLVLLPLAARYALRSVSPRTHGLEMLTFALVFNSHLHWGFYNFLYSLCFYLLGLGYWLRHRGELTPPRTAVLAGLVLLIYLCHPVSLVEFVLAVGILSLTEWKLLRRSVWPTAAALAPALALYANYAAASPSLAYSTEWPTLRYAASTLLKLAPLGTWSPSEFRLALLVSAVLGLASLAAARAWWQERGSMSFAVASTATACVVLVAPVSAGVGTMITPRLVYYPVFLLLLWLCTRRDWRRWQGGFVAAGIVVFTGFLALHWPVYDRYDRKMKTFLQSLEALRPHRSVFFSVAERAVPLLLTDAGAPWLSAGAIGYATAERHQILLSDYEATVDCFPLTFRPQVDPATHLLVSGSDRRCAQNLGVISPTRYRESTQRLLDYVVVLDERPEGRRVDFRRDCAADELAGYREQRAELGFGVLTIYERAEP